MKRKSLITCFAFFLCVFSVSVYAQVGKSQLGKVTYLEGQAQLTNDQVTTPVGINTVLYANQYIKTAPKSVVEILWSNGAKTSIEPSATKRVGFYRIQKSFQISHRIKTCRGRGYQKVQSQSGHYA